MPQFPAAACRGASVYIISAVTQQLGILLEANRSTLIASIYIACRRAALRHFQLKRRRRRRRRRRKKNEKKKTRLVPKSALCATQFCSIHNSERWCYYCVMLLRFAIFFRRWLIGRVFVFSANQLKPSTPDGPVVALEQQTKEYRRGTTVCSLGWLRGLKKWVSLVIYSKRATGTPERYR